MPFAIAEQGLDSLHQESHQPVEDDAVAKVQRLGRGRVNFGVASERTEGVLGIPEESTEERQTEHAGDFDRDRDTEKNQRENQHPGTIQGTDRGHELLENAGREGKENNADGILDHKG